MDWKQTIKSVAPTLGTLLATFGGPAGALAGAGLVAVGNAIGVPMSGDPARDEAAIAAAVQGGLSPEQRAALIAADLDYKRAVLRADVEKVGIAADVEKAYITDVTKARETHVNTVWVMRLAVFINIASYLAIGGVLYGCFSVLTTTVAFEVDPGIAAMVGSLIGAAVQWLLSNASQANGFAFGSSPSSRAVSEGLTKAVSNVTSK